MRAVSDGLAAKDIQVRSSWLGRHSPEPERDMARAAGQRIRDFDEVRRGLDADDARVQAARCIGCGTCTQCDLCRAHCPEGVLTRDGDEYRFDYDDCKGCGVCAFECPRGVLVMQQL